MQSIPLFPCFKPFEPADRQFIKEIICRYGPETSELTFVNFFIWRKHYDFQWSVHKDWLCVIGREGEGPFFAMGPIGPPERVNVSRLVLEWLRDEKGVSAPAIERADGRLVSELRDMPHVTAEPVREHFDYLYLTQNLIDLAGSRYRAKRNYINQFHRSNVSYAYEPLEERHLEACRTLQEKWCMLRRCREDLNLLGEWDAVKEILENYNTLEVDGAVISIDGKVCAFTLGELLNEDTAVIHIEKADPGIPGLYQLINQQFCAQRWRGTRYVNREQDLGIPGLRESKLSYGPVHFAEKFRIRLIP